MKVTLRPVEPNDEPFLYRVYAGTRQEELAQVPWTEAQKEAFLRMQFDAQARYYREHYAGAEFSIILSGDLPVGRLYVARWPDEIRIVDIALLPECRNAGIGASLLKNLISESERTGKPLTAHCSDIGPCGPLEAWKLL
jgi:ribosomal protein S18 acetylase RimI-like enzyme